MSYSPEQGVPREVLIQREIQAIPDYNTKYQRWLQLTTRNPLDGVAFTIPRHPWRRFKSW